MVGVSPGGAEVIVDVVAIGGEGVVVAGISKTVYESNSLNSSSNAGNGGNAGNGCVRVCGSGLGVARVGNNGTGVVRDWITGGVGCDSAGRLGAGVCGGGFDDGLDLSLILNI